MIRSSTRDPEWLVRPNQRGHGRAPYDVVVPSAVIVDQWSLVRLGIGAVLRSLDVKVIGDEASARDGLQHARENVPDLVVFGSHLDVDVAHAVRQAARLDPPPRS